MGVWNDFPYTDFHNQNIDWLLNLAVGLKKQLDNGFADAINQWITDNYNTLFFNAMYNPETETITFANEVYKNE